MNIEDLALKQQETQDRSIRNEGRIEKLEEESGVLHNLATSVAVMAEQLKGMNENIATMKTEVEEIARASGIAHNGEYTIEDDGQPEPTAQPTTDERLAKLEKAMEDIPALIGEIIKTALAKQGGTQ